MSADDDRKLDDPQRREFIKKLAAITSGAAAGTYLVPKIAMAQAGGGLSPGPVVPQVIVQSLFDYIQTQGSPDAMVLWMTQNMQLSPDTPLFIYDTVRSFTTVGQLNEFVNGSGPMPGLPPGPLAEARMAVASASASASQASKWPWE